MNFDLNTRGARGFVVDAIVIRGPGQSRKVVVRVGDGTQNLVYGGKVTTVAGRFVREKNPNLAVACIFSATLKIKLSKNQI